MMSGPVKQETSYEDKISEDRLGESKMPDKTIIDRLKFENDSDEYELDAARRTNSSNIGPTSCRPVKAETCYEGKTEDQHGDSQMQDRTIIDKLKFENDTDGYEVDAAGRRISSGIGPTSSKTHVGMVDSHFEDDPLVIPLPAKRRRVVPLLDHGYDRLSPSAATTAPPHAPPSRSAYDGQPVPLTSAAPTASQPYAPPSPIPFIEYEVTPTPRSIRRPGSRPIIDVEISDILHNGSEEEPESDDDEEGPPPSLGVRVLRAMEEMAEDKEEKVAAASRVDVAEATEEVDGVMHEPTTMFDFKWQAFPSTPISPRLRREQFVGVSGPMIDPIPSIHDAFVEIWDRTIMEHIVLETNIYAQQYCEELLRLGEIDPTSGIALWKDTDVDELYTFFGLVVAMGLIVKSKQADYWLTADAPDYTPFFSSVMPMKRFQILSKFLHFNRNCPSLLNLTPSQAKIYKIEPIISHLNSKFSSMYSLGQNIALDESLTQWKGGLDIKQYIPNQAVAVGIKTYEVCDSRSGYLWRFECHEGGEVPDQGIVSGSIPNLVLRLLRGLEHRGHTVWMDNYYNSPALARVLKSTGYDCVGTLCINRQFVPLEVTELTNKDMRKGHIYGSTSGDIDLIVWRDKNRVAMISTYHGTGVSEGKPIVVRDYKICMGGVDNKDQVLSSYPIERKPTHVWYKRFFWRLLNVSILNAYILYKHTHNNTTHRDFRRQLVLDLIKFHHRIPTIELGTQILFTDEVMRHLPSALPIIPNAARGGRYRRQCVHCKVRRSTFMCRGCNVALCADFTKPKEEVCFINYHSTED